MIGESGAPKVQPPKNELDNQKKEKKEDVFELDKKEEKKDQVQENVEENIDIIKERMTERYGKDSKRESLVLYDYLQRIFYRRYDLHNSNIEECSKDTKMIEIIEFFQKELDELIDKFSKEDDDFRQSHWSQFNNLTQKLLILLGRHGEMVEDRHFRYMTAFTLFKAAYYVDIKSIYFNTLIPKIFDLRGTKHVRDRLSLSGEGFEEKIISKISEILDLMREGDDELAKKVLTDSSKKITSGVRIELLKKAQNIIIQFSKELNSGEKISDEKNKKLLEDLENYEKNLMLKISVLKSLEGQILPEEIAGIDFEVETAKNISFGHEKELEDIAKIISTREGKFVISASGLGVMISKFEKGEENEEESREKFSELWQMLSMYENNWKKYSPEMRKILLGGFLKKISQNGDGTRIYKYKDNEKLLTFLRIDDIEPGKKYFGSFNALDSIKGGKMGEALLTRVFEEEGNNADIQAVCVPQEDVLAYYINKHRFVVNGIIMNYEGTGQSMAKIERRKEVAITKHYYSDYEEKDIVSEYENNFSGNRQKKEKYLILKYKLSKNDKNIDQSREMNERIQDLTGQEYIITREVIEKISKNNKNIYLCFEKN